MTLGLSDGRSVPWDVAGGEDLVLVKHTPMEPGKTSGVYKEDCPVSYMFIPPVGYKWQVQSKVTTVRCARFDGSIILDALPVLTRADFIIIILPRRGITRG